MSQELKNDSSFNLGAQLAGEEVKPPLQKQ